MTDQHANPNTIQQEAEKRAERRYACGMIPFCAAMFIGASKTEDVSLAPILFLTALCCLLLALLFFQSANHIRQMAGLD